MRNFGRAKQEEETEIDITPMLDVVFIMLIFFIVTATFVKEAGTDVFKPDAKYASPMKTANILIAIDANDQVWIDGGPVEITAIAANIKRLKSENPKGKIMIQADKDSTHGRLIDVHNGAKQAVGEENANSLDIALSTESG